MISTGQGHALESEDRAYLSNTISSRYEHGERPFRKSLTSFSNSQCSYATIVNDDDSSSVESEF